MNKLPPERYLLCTKNLWLSDRLLGNTNKQIHGYHISQIVRLINTHEVYSRLDQYDKWYVLELTKAQLVDLQLSPKTKFDLYYHQKDVFPWRLKDCNLVPVGKIR